jgi:hypothetical protein
MTSRRVEQPWCAYACVMSAGEMPPWTVCHLILDATRWTAGVGAERASRLSLLGDHCPCLSFRTGDPEAGRTPTLPRGWEDSHAREVIVSGDGREPGVVGPGRVWRARCTGREARSDTSPSLSASPDLPRAGQRPARRAVAHLAERPPEPPLSPRILQQHRVSRGTGVAEQLGPRVNLRRPSPQQRLGSCDRARPALP